MVFLPPGFAHATAGQGQLPNLPLSHAAFAAATFPNQPYEEKKYL